MKIHASAPPKDLSRPAPRDPKPLNPAMMIALGRALFARRDA